MRNDCLQFKNLMNATDHCAICECVEVPPFNIFAESMTLDVIDSYVKTTMSKDAKKERSTDELSTPGPMSSCSPSY